MNVDGRKLRAYVDRWNNLEADKKTAAEDQAQLLSDMEATDFIEKKPFKALIKYLKDQDEARHQQEKFDNLLAVYLNFDETPLGRAAAKVVDAKRYAEGASLVDKIAGHIQEAQPGTVLGALGVAREVTDEERGAGVIAAFDGPDGTTSTISVPSKAMRRKAAAKLDAARAGETVQ